MTPFPQVAPLPEQIHGVWEIGDVTVAWNKETPFALQHRMY